MTNKLLFTVILLLFFQITFSQLNNFNYPPKSFYKNAKITLKDYTKYEVIDLKITSDSVFFINKTTLKNNVLMISEIDYFRVQNGTQALKLAGWCGLGLGLIAFINVVDHPEIDRGKVIIGFTISGAAIGGLIGLAIPKWKTYYLLN